MVANSHLAGPELLGRNNLEVRARKVAIGGGATEREEIKKGRKGSAWQQEVKEEKKISLLSKSTSERVVCLLLLLCTSVCTYVPRPHLDRNT